MMNKKGQAAMEFLMTYGWAILAAVVVIGVLAYFGVFNPGTYTPQPQDKFNYECLAIRACSSVGMSYINTGWDDVTCRERLNDGVYKIHNFKLNLSYLKTVHKECKK